MKKISIFMLLFLIIPMFCFALNPPTQATLLSITDTSMVLKWQDSEGYELGYIIERDSGTGYDSIGECGPGSGIMTYSGTGMSGLTPDKMYRYRVYGYDADTTSDYEVDSMWTIKTIIATKADNSYQGGNDDGYAFYSTVPFPLPPLIIKQATLLSIADTSMVLKWSDESGYELGYIIERDSGTGYDSVGSTGPGNGIMTYDSTGMSGLTPDKKYKYRINAYNASDTVSIEDSMWTTKAILTKAGNTYEGGKNDGYAFYTTVAYPIPPVVIERATLLDIADTSMVLKWQDETGYELGYIIKRDSGTGYDSVGECGPGSGIMTYTGTGMSGLTPDKKYKYRINAYNASDTVSIEDSMWTTKVILTKAGNTYEGGKDDGYAFYELSRPTAFSLISPSDSSILSISRPTFVWETSYDSISGLIYYETYINDTLRHTGIDTVWTADYDLTEGYNDWYVVAYNNGNMACQSNETLTVIIDTTPPSTVTLISPADSSYLNNSTVNFVWNKATDNVSGVDHYVLQYAFDNGFTQGLIETTTVDTAFTIALADTIYYWHVKAVDAATNEGAFSTTWQFEVDTQSPNAPILTSPVGGIWLNNTSVDFQWSAVTFGDGNKLSANGDGISLSLIRYILEVDTTTGFISPLVVDTLAATSTTKTLSEDFYYWRVKAYDLAGNQGPYANPDSFGVDTTPPSIESTTVWSDTSFAGPFSVFTKVTDSLSGMDSVILYYKRIEDPIWIGLSMSDSGSGWYYNEIPQVYVTNDTIRYYIYAIDIVHNVSTDPAGAPTNFYSFIANMTGIEESSAELTKFKFNVKTPAKGKVIFKFNIPEICRVDLKIYDIMGRLVSIPASGKYSEGSHKASFTPKANGIYFYRLNSKFGNRKGKIVLF